jgi:DNA-binding PadR family transcriptional regulator
MQFTITMNQVKALEWGLNAQQALLFAFVYECPSWAKPVRTDGGIFYALSKAKILEELPLLTDKPDTAYRLLKQLEAAGVIELSHTAGITLVRLTDKGREWNRKVDGSEKYPKSCCATSEKKQCRVGKKSEVGRKNIREGSEKSPTNQDTSQVTNQETSLEERCAPSAHAPADDDLFARFWALYPRKQDKAKAQKAWAKLKVDADLFALIAKGLAAQAASHDWLKDGGKYVPMPTTWLNGRRWEDEVKTNVHHLPTSRHSGFDQRDYRDGLIEREDGTYGF